MTTREQLNHERVQAILEILEEREGVGIFGDIQRSRDRGDARAEARSFQRAKAITEIKADLQAADSTFDTAEADYLTATQAASDAEDQYINATTDSERIGALAQYNLSQDDQFAALLSVVLAQREMIREISEYLLLSENSVVQD